ncbi:MAG: heme biosynthesis protein HemY [Pararhodobacter sp.]|nr:heme biosynthesis protein HemY [Pararhodobacter sp.]
MLWTILKIVLFLAAAAALALGVEYLTDSPFALQLAVADMEFTLGPVQAAVAALVVLALLWLLMKLVALVVAVLRFINGDETAISRYFERSRKRRGLEALTDGFLALAAGEGEAAVSKARKAEKLLENRTLTNLLMAQAAQTKGNTALAGEYFKRLLADERSRFVGVQGLMRQQIEAGNTDKARKLAAKALDMHPAHGATQDTLMSLQNESGDWQGARRTLAEVKRAGRLPRDVYHRRDAVLALQQAQACADGGESDLAQDLAIEAHRLSPGLVPAAAMAARAQMARGSSRKAASILKKAWKLAPHPELAQAYAEIEPGESPAERVRRFEKLLSANEGDEARMTRAELLIGAEDFPAARRAIGSLHETAPTQRVMTIMAAIERGEGSDDAVVRGWLARALTAPRGPQWVCENCQHIHSSWVAICEHCKGFDTLSWKSPPDSSGPSATGTEMLPLIVGALRAPEREPEPTPANDADISAEAEPASERQEASPPPPEDAGEGGEESTEKPVNDTPEGAGDKPDRGELAPEAVPEPEDDGERRLEETRRQGF